MLLLFLQSVSLIFYPSVLAIQNGRRTSVQDVFHLRQIPVSLDVAKPLTRRGVFRLVIFKALISFTWPPRLLLEGLLGALRRGLHPEPSVGHRLKRLVLAPPMVPIMK